MRKYIVGMLGVVILFLGSVIYKQQHKMVFHHFPIPESLKQKTDDPPLYLFIFFKKNDCQPCVVEMVEVLNTLPSQFCAAGIVPEEELKDELGLRRLIGESFPLYCYQKYKKYLPWDTPTLFGVSPAGKIIFVLPDIQSQRPYLRNFLVSIYKKLYPSSKKEHSPVIERR
ncbi:MAG: hypothetical protein JSV88_00040 [Candidatus Aminicenantes bacterium]|nr:MAG: hypothetical protein JSV88_00040 [Candidatus Aminicenantes bacterium]